MSSVDRLCNREIYALPDSGMSHPDNQWKDLPVKLGLCVDQESIKAVDAHETDRTSTADTETDHYWSSEEDLSVQLNLVKGFGEEAQVRRRTRRPEVPKITGKEGIKKEEIYKN